MILGPKLYLGSIEEWAKINAPHAMVVSYEAAQIYKLFNSAISTQNY
jgi:hypothetical protein